jgi:hypothetical protein
MDWSAIVTSVTSTAVIVAAIAWLTKSAVSHLLSRDVERFKSHMECESALAVENLRSSLHLEAEKRIIEYSSLHGKRAGLLTELYAKLFDLHRCIARLQFEYQGREIREDCDRKSPFKRQPWELAPGLELLDKDEEAAIKELSSCSSELYRFYGRYRLFFPRSACESIDRICTLASFLSVNYQNVALKDKDGNLYVDPKVKSTWDQAMAVIPSLLTAIDSEFRQTLGSEDRRQPNQAVDRMPG